MTKYEANLLHRQREKYWREFSKLVAKHYQAVPAKLQNLFLMQMQEKSSVYGSNFEKYLK